MSAFLAWCWRIACTIARALFSGALRGMETGTEVWVARQFG